MGRHMQAQHEPQRHGQRVFVLWVCWVLLAAFLFAAGVVALR